MAGLAVAKRLGSALRACFAARRAWALREKVPIWIDQTGALEGVGETMAADGAVDGAGTGGSAVRVIGAALALAGPIIPAACEDDGPNPGIL